MLIFTTDALKVSVLALTKEEVLSVEVGGVTQRGVDMVSLPFINRPIG